MIFIDYILVVYQSGKSLKLLKKYFGQNICHFQVPISKSSLNSHIVNVC